MYTFGKGKFLSKHPVYVHILFAHTFLQQWNFGQAGCNYYGFLMTVLGLFSINILTLISFERYICISLPRYQHVLSMRSITAALSVCLGIALAWGVFPLAGTGQSTVGHR